MMTMREEYVHREEGDHYADDDDDDVDDDVDDDGR